MTTKKIKSSAQPDVPSDENDAPEEVSTKDLKKQHDKIESMKLSKKRKRLNTNIVSSLLKEENQIENKKKPSHTNLETKNNYKFEKTPELKNKRIDNFELDVEILDTNRTNFIDPNIKNWLQKHFYGERIQRI
eukprot:gene3156-5472_t